MSRLSTVSLVSKAIKREPPPITQDLRAEWIGKMQAILEAAGTQPHFHADFQSRIGNVHIQVQRNRTALAAIWSVGEWNEETPYDPAAVCVLLGGMDAKEDSDAMAAFQKIRGLEDIREVAFDDIKNAPRPSLGVFYFDPILYESGLGEAIVTGLALAHVAGPDAVAKRSWN